MYKLLAAVAAAFVLLPNAVATVIFAQRGHEFMPCLCCLDVRTPDFGPVGNVIIMILGLAFIIFMIWGAAADSIQKEKVIRETKENYENWVHRNVTLVSDPNFRGAVVYQEYDKLYINAVNQYGTLYQVVRTISEVRQVPDANSVPQKTDSEVRPPNVGEGDTGGH